MKYFFTRLRYIKLKNIKKDYIEILPGLRITDKKKIKEQILTEQTRKIIGFIETNNILTSETILYYEYSDNEKIWQGINHLEILENILHWIDSLLKNSWLHKDNCIVSDTAFLIDSASPTAQASSLRLEYKHTLATGELDTIYYCEDDLNKLTSIHHKVETYLYDKDSLSIRFMLEKNFSRIGRALLFVKQGRESRNIAYKLSHYCSALETIFTTDNMEISHKLAERTAFFLSDRLSKPNVFSIIKKAYTVRSKLTHGASLDSKQINTIFDISSETDSILRESFIKILNDKVLIDLFDSNNQKIDKYFLELIME